jgi:hypothetical protein
LSSITVSALLAGNRHLRLMMNVLNELTMIPFDTEVVENPIVEAGDHPSSQIRGGNVTAYPAIAYSSKAITVGDRSSLNGYYRS